MRSNIVDWKDFKIQLKGFTWDKPPCYRDDAKTDILESSSIIRVSSNTSDDNAIYTKWLYKRHL